MIFFYAPFTPILSQSRETSEARKTQLFLCFPERSSSPPNVDHETSCCDFACCLSTTTITTSYPYFFPPRMTILQRSSSSSGSSSVAPFTAGFLRGKQKATAGSTLRGIVNVDIEAARKEGFEMIKVVELRAEQVSWEIEEGEGAAREGRRRSIVSSSTRPPSSPTTSTFSVLTSEKNDSGPTG